MKSYKEEKLYLGAGNAFFKSSPVDEFRKSVFGEMNLAQEPYVTTSFINTVNH
jgi:hypothetical protein